MCVNNFEIFLLIPVRIKWCPALRRRRNYRCSRTRRFATYPIDREFIGAEVPGAEATRAELLGRANLETLFLPVENNVLRSSTLVRAYISRFMLLAGEGRASFGDFFRAPTIPCFRRPKKDPTRELWYFARNAPWCFSSDVATLPVLFRPPPSLFLHLTTWIRSTISSPCSARPTFDRHPPSPFPSITFPSFS